MKRIGAAWSAVFIDIGMNAVHSFFALSTHSAGLFALTAAYKRAGNLSCQRFFAEARFALYKNGMRQP